MYFWPSNFIMSKETQTSKENELLAAIQQGDWSAYRVLFDRYYPLLCTYGTRYVSLEEAEEIAQDTFLWLWEHRTEMPIATSLHHYLFSMVHHRSINLILHNQARSKAEARFLESVEEMLDDTDTIQLHELQQKIKESLASLPDTYREAFMLHRFGDKSYKEIAELLQVSPKTVDYRIQQALKQLRILLKDYSPLLVWLIGGATLPMQ